MAKKNKINPKPGITSRPLKTTEATSSNAANDWLGRVETLLSMRKNAVWIVLLLLSLSIHGLYFQQTKDTPARTIHTWEQSDMAFYDYCARHILSGDILCDTALQPYHVWHDMYAAGYFRSYPETAATYYSKYTDSTGRIDTLAAKQAMIADTHQGKVYYQEPLYAYLIALTYSIFGPDPLWVYLWQMLLGACSVLLVYLISSRYFGFTAGVLAALLVLLSGPVLVFDFTLLRTTLTTFLTLLLVFTYQRMLDKNDRKSQLAFGATGGIAILAQSYLMLFFLPALGWYAWLHRGNKKALLTGLAFLLAAYVVVMSPLYIRNILVGVPVTAVRSNGAITYAMFNSSKSRPLEPNFTEMEFTVKIMHDSDGKFGKAVFASMKTFDNLQQALNLYKQKIDGLFMWFENPNNMSYYMFREFSPLLSGLPAPYRFLAPLGIAGLLIGLWRLRLTILPFLLVTLVSAGPLFISTSLSRYRIPFAVLLSILAAYFIIQMIQGIVRGNWKLTTAGILMAAICWFYTDNIRDHRFYPLYANDFTSIYICHYQARLTKLEKENDFESYTRLTNELVSYVPEHFYKLRADDELFSSNEAESCQMVARIFTMHGKALSAISRGNEGAVFLERAQILNTVAERFRQTYLR